MAEAAKDNNVPALIGPFTIGIQVSCVFTGIIIVQTWNYSRTSQDDTVYLRLYVAAIVALTMASTGADMAILWGNSVADFGNYDAIKRHPISRVVSLYCDSFISLFVQGFFAYRSWKATDRSYFLLLLMTLFICATFVGMFGTATLEALESSLSTIASKDWAILMWLWGSCVADWTISSILIWRLGKSRAQALPDSTQDMLTMLLRVVLTTAALTSLMALADAILYSVTGTKDNGHMAFAVNLARVYVISFLYTLNSRESLRRTINAGSSGPPGSSSASRNTWTPRRTTAIAPNGKSIHTGSQSLSSNSGGPGHGQVVVTQTQEISYHRGEHYDLENMRPEVKVTPTESFGAPYDGEFLDRDFEKRSFVGGSEDADTDRPIAQ